MGNSSQNKTNSLLDEQRKKTQSSFDPINNEARDRSRTAYNDSQSRIPGLSDRYTALADTGGYDPTDFDKLRASFGGGGGGSSVANDLSETGGIDESKFDEALGGYREFSHGDSGVDTEGIRARSNRAIPSFYKNLSNEAERRRLVNPYAPSFDAESASMARQSGQQTQDAIRDTETGISELISKNRQFGISGLGNLNTSIQGMKQQGKIAGGQQQISNAGLSESAAARRQSGEMGILEMQQRGKLAGIGGLHQLKDESDNEAGNYFDRLLQGNTGVNGAQLENIRSRQNTTPWWKTVLGAGASAAGSYYGAKA